MKKTYNSPVITIVEVKIQSALMELSIKNENANSAAMGRQSSDWEDE